MEGHCGNHHRDGCHHLPAAGGEEEVPGATSLHLRPVPALGPGSPLRPPPLRVVRDHLLLQADQATSVRPDHTRERGGHPFRNEGGGEPPVQPDAGTEGAGAHGGNGGGGPRPEDPCLRDPKPRRRESPSLPRRLPAA